MPASATVGTMIGQFAAPAGAASLSVYPNPNALDLIQITIPGLMDSFSGEVALRVSSAGVVTTFTTTYTLGTLFGVYQAPGATTSSTTAQVVAAAFVENPSQLDIFQVVNPQGIVGLFHLDYLGVAFFS